MLVLLPTDHNKLLMQWKGPFEVSSKVGLIDYKVKVYHANLLKKYIYILSERRLQLKEQ